tara:strand:- start:726 stop:830 length:105 start_codon:yes stop_codon:yes gene_type:complete
MPDHYRVLGLERDASEADIKKVRRGRSTLPCRMH